MKSASGNGTDNIINERLDDLENVKAKIQALQAEADEVISEIRRGFSRVVVVFIDMTESTQFKSEHAETPEQWILRAKQFLGLVKEYVQSCDGKVVKYIGDEVMAVFDRQSMVNDSLNFVSRLQEIEENLTIITGHETKIKISLDIGNIYFLALEGHSEPDPMGPCVDRVARIGKFVKPSTVLTSYDFVKESSPHIKWTKVGSTKLKGIGEINIYQLGKSTTKITEIVEIGIDELRAMEDDAQNQKSVIEELEMQNRDIKRMNDNLLSDLKEVGKEPDAEDIYEDEGDEQGEEDLWEKIEGKISELRKLINFDGLGYGKEYARFLFLWNISTPEKYDTFEGRTFDRTIEKGLVHENRDGYYMLDGDHRRNKQAISLMRDLEDLLRDYEENYRDEDDGNLYDFSLKDPEFWSHEIQFNVDY